MDVTINTYYNGLDLGKGNRPIKLEPTGESWIINFADSAACQDLKIGSGVGESRLFVGQRSDSHNICSFFNTKAFFFDTLDLLSYLEEAKDEFFNPTQPYLYLDRLSHVYTLNKLQLQAAQRRIVGLRYNIKIDPSRCYLVLDPPYRNDYRIFRNICIPKMTEVAFEKYIHVHHEDVYIKMTPFFKL
jgi:hypothetical protein